MSAEDKRIQYIIETIDKTSGGLDAANGRINALDKEIKQLNSSASRLNNTVDNTGRKMKTAMSEPFNYGRKLSGQMNELAMRFIGITAGVQAFRWLSEGIVEAGLETETMNKNIEIMQATIGEKFLPVAQKAVDWFNNNYKKITEYVLDFIRSVEIGFKGLATVPLMIAEAFYTIKSKLPGKKEGKEEAARFAQAYRDEIKATFDNIGVLVEQIKQKGITTVTPKSKRAKAAKNETTGGYGDYNIPIPEYMTGGDALAQRIAAYQEGESVINKLRNETIEAGLQSIADGTERELAILEYKYQRELELYENVFGAKDEINARYAIQKDAIEAESSKKALEIQKKENEMKIQGYQQIGGAFSSLMGAIGQATKENAKAQKAVAIVQAIINTALGVTQAIAQGGVAGIVTGALVAAAGAVQIATIASQNFALGGVARRTPGAVSDSVPINVNPDERIVTKRQQNNLTRFLNNPDNAGSRGDTYNIYDYSGDLVATLENLINTGRGDRLNRTLNSRFAMA